MNSYILIVLADILLALTFIFQKKYQKTAGTSIRAGLIYNALLGAFSTLMFLCINRFEIKVTAFSILMAAIFATAAVLYTFVGFRLMEKGNMSIGESLEDMKKGCTNGQQ